MGATPAWPGAGVTVTVRLLPEPPKRMFALGTRLVLADEEPRVRLEAGDSASPMVKGIGWVVVPGCVLVAGTEEMTGAVLAGKTVTTNEVLLDLPPESMTQTVI